MEEQSFLFGNSENHTKNIYCDPLPFSNFENDEVYPFFNETNFNIFNLNYNKEKIENSTEILNKIDKFQDTYYNNIISCPNTDAKLHDKQILEKNLNLIENTLPGFIICLLYKNNNTPVDEETIFEKVLKNYNNLRKPNGSRYKGNINKVFKSTLSSSGLFIKFNTGKWSYNEKEAVNYVLRVTEKILTKRLDKDKKTEPIQEETRTTKSDKKISSKRKIKRSQDEANYKIHKVYKMLDDLLNMYKSDKVMEKSLKNPFKNINSSIELLQKIGNDNKCVGILMCFKFFRTIINKFIKIITKKTKGDKDTVETNSINDKIILLNKKIEFIQKYFFAEKQLKKDAKVSVKTKSSLSNTSTFDLDNIN